MKTMPLALLLCALPVLVVAPSTGAAEPDEPLNSYKTYKTGQQPASASQRPSFGEASQRKVGGFVVECVSAPSRGSLFNLRQPEDPKRDLRNVSFDPVTGKAAGFKLFTFNF